jgi:hypothetical protein
MALTDVAIRNAKPRAKPYKMGDALGLFLLVQPTGGIFCTVWPALAQAPMEGMTVAVVIR